MSRHSSYVVGRASKNFPLPFLTTLVVRPPGGADSATELREAIWRISYAPSLRNGYFVMFDKVGMELPMHQLTQITMKSCIWQDCLSLLASAPNVVHYTTSRLKVSFQGQPPRCSCTPLSVESYCGILGGGSRGHESFGLYHDPCPLSDAGYMECN